MRILSFLRIGKSTPLRRKLPDRTLCPQDLPSLRQTCHQNKRQPQRNPGILPKLVNSVAARTPGTRMPPLPVLCPLASLVPTASAFRKSIPTLHASLPPVSKRGLSLILSGKAHGANQAILRIKSMELARSISKIRFTGT